MAMARVRIKFCGLTHPDDVADAVAAGADAVGFNFYPKSPRYIDPRAAEPLIGATPPNVVPVGVFVTGTIDELRSTAARLGLREIQWHGDGPPPEGDYGSFPLVAACRIRDAADLDAISVDAARLRFTAVLIDAHAPSQLGGTGQTAPWDLLRGFDPGVPVILAGGLTPENVAEAIRIVRPYGVDVASGVESSPGRKDAEKMRQFVAAVRSADA
jgi:phosphoribosylanthranilate isomerase